MSQPTAAHATPTPASGSRRYLIALYASAVFLYWMALYLYVPTLPVYVESKSDSLALVGIVLSMYGLWQAIIRLPVGIAADWLGWHKPFIVIGFGLAALGAWSMGVAQDANGILVGRAITGLAAGTWVPLIVVFSSLFPPEEAVRASAILALVGSLGRILATSANGSLNHLGGYSLAFFLAAGAAVLAILVVLPARERRLPRKSPSPVKVGRLISRRDVLLPSLLAAVNQYVNWAATFGFVPILAKGMGAGDVAQSMLVSLSVAGVTLGNLGVSAFANRLAARRLIAIGFVLLSLGVGGTALTSSLPLLFICQFGIGLSQGISAPVLMGMSIRYVGNEERATAMGSHQAIYAIGMFSGPYLSGMLADAMGIQPMFGVTAFACLLLGIMGTRWLRG